jgi:hypothetical protein
VVHAPAPTQLGSQGVPGQFAFADSAALIARLTSPSGASVLATGLMPAARLTYDRFWTDPPGSAVSPAARFSAAALGAPIATPGTVNAAFDLGTAPGFPPGRASPKTLVARDSDFARTFSWSVNTVLSGASVPVSGQTSPEATVSLIDYCRPRGAGGAVQNPASDTLRARLTVVSTLGQTVSTEQSVPIENATPQLRSPLSARFVAPGGTLRLPLTDLFSDFGDRSTISPGDAVCSSPAGQCDVSAGALTFTPAIDVPSTSVSVTATDCDGDAATGTFAVNVVTTPPANPDAFATNVRAIGSTAPSSFNVRVNETVPTGTLSVLDAFAPRTACEVNPARIDCPSRNSGAASGDPTVLTTTQASATQSALILGSDGQAAFTPTEAVFAAQTFTYRNRRTEGGVTVESPSATVTVSINPSVNNFATVRTILENNCVSCHGSAENNVAKARMCLVTGPVVSVNPGTAAGQCPSGTPASFYDSLVRNIRFAGGSSDTSALRVNVRSPTTSELLVYTADPAHTGENFSIIDAATVLQWIREGAWGP